MPAALISFDPRSRAMPARAQRGVASLVVVMVLFFIISLVAAYTSRNLIFEQRTSVNQYRSTQALEAAEAGLEWALALLNGGRIGTNCLEAGAAATDTSFRQRYLVIDPATGLVTPATQPTLHTEFTTSCVWTGAGWQCSCPLDSAPTLAAPVGTAVYPAFRVRFTANGLTRPGLVRIESNGCTRLDDACLNFPSAATEQEGRAQVSALVALKSALTTPPAAPLTVQGNVDGAALTAYNTDPGGTGVTVQAAGTVNPLVYPTLFSVPGTPASDSVVASDATLSPPATPDGTHPTPDRYFASMFGAWPESYRLQPAAVRVNCPAAPAGCRATLANVVARNPDRVIWIPGDLNLESGGDIGSAPDPADPTVAGPAVIVATGRVRFLVPGVRIFGLVHTRDGNWEGSGEIRGAASTEGNLAAAAAPTIVLDQAVLDTLRLRHGSFVRLPGGWKDFP